MSSELVYTRANYELVTGDEAERFLNGLGAAGGVNRSPWTRRRSLTIRKTPYLQWRALGGEHPEVGTNIVAWRGYLLDVAYRLEQRPYQDDNQGKVLCYSRRVTIGGHCIEKDYPLPLPFYAPSQFQRTEENGVRQMAEVRVIDPQLQELQPVGSNPDRGRSCAECVAQGNHVIVDGNQQIACGGVGYILFCVIDVGIQEGYRPDGRQIRYRIRFTPIEEYSYLDEKPFSGPIIIRAWIGRQLALRNVLTAEPSQYGAPEGMQNLANFLRSQLRQRGATRVIKRNGTYQVQYLNPVEMYVLPPLDSSRVGCVPLFRVAPEMRAFPSQEGSDVHSWLDLAWLLYDAEEAAADDSFHYGEEPAES